MWTFSVGLYLSSNPMAYVLTPAFCPFTPMWEARGCPSPQWLPLYEAKDKNGLCLHHAQLSPISWHLSSLPTLVQVNFIGKKRDRQGTAGSEILLENKSKAKQISSFWEFIFILMIAYM